MSQLRAYFVHFRSIHPQFQAVHEQCSSRFQRVLRRRIYSYGSHSSYSNFLTGLSTIIGISEVLVHGKSLMHYQCGINEETLRIEHNLLSISSRAMAAHDVVGIFFVDLFEAIRGEEADVILDIKVTEVNTLHGCRIFRQYMGLRSHCNDENFKKNWS